MEITNQEHYDKAIEFAKSTGQLDQLEEKFTHLKDLAENFGGRMILGYDFAPYSFSFSIVRGDNCVLNGGLIYHGSHDNGGDGGSPTFSVCMSPVAGWSIHT